MQNSVSLSRIVPNLHQKENEAALCVCIDYTEIFPVTMHSVLYAGRQIKWTDVL